MGDLANRIGGTEESPCPTGLTTFKVFGSLYCNDNDYQSWRLAARDMYTRGILPSYNQYLAAAKAAGEVTPEGAGQLWGSVEAYRQEYEALPESTLWKAKTSLFVQKVISLMQSGELTLKQVRDATAALGVSPLELPSGPTAPTPRRSINPWWFVFGGVALTGIGVGVGYAIKGGK